MLKHLMMLVPAQAQGMGASGVSQLLLLLFSRPRPSSSTHRPASPCSPISPCSKYKWYEYNYLYQNTDVADAVSKV